MAGLLVVAHRHRARWCCGSATGRSRSGIVLVADRLAALMLLVASLVSLAVLVYSTGQDEDEMRRETPVSIFHPTFLLLVAGVSNAFLAGDLFNLFVSFEMLLFASYVLLTMGGTEDRIRAGSVYVVVNLVSSPLFLVAIASIYAADRHGEPGPAGAAARRPARSRCAACCR